MKLLRNFSIVMASVLLFSCSDNNNGVASFNVQVNSELPAMITADYTIVDGNITFTEVNTGSNYDFQYPIAQGDVNLPVGVYNIAGEMEVTNGENSYNLKTSLYQYTVTGDATLNLKWMIFNPQNTLVFGEVFFTGSLNAKGTGGLYDSYFTIYNNTDQVQYADGIAIVESKLLNTATDIIITPANQRDVNFTVQTVYVIPGNGTQVPVLPGESIKIVDQAIDWSEQLSHALNHTDADFEWFDQSSSASVVDTDNPDVPNLDKWYSYSPTIWLPSNQCNRSYALVRFPADMTMDRFLLEQKGDYDYVNAATGNQMKGQKCFLIKPEWIIDGINLCPTEKFTQPVLPATIDRSYAAISSKNADVNRFGKKFVRKQAGTTAAGCVVLQDTDNSADDFEIVPVK